MAAPTPTARVAPGGIMLKEGYKTVVTFAADTDVSLWEQAVKPPDVDGGDPIDTTTMHNVTWRSSHPRALKSLQNAQASGGYDPDVINQIIALVNVNTTITETFPDGSTLAYYGYLRAVEFGELVEGELPECTFQIEPTNWDPTNRVVAGPVLTSIAGT